MKFLRSLLVLFSLLISPLTHATPTKKDLKLGIVLALSGPAAVHGNALRAGIELAADELRKEGWDISLMVEDDETNPGKTVSSLQRLLAKKIRIIIGPTWSFQINAALPVIEKNRILAVSPSGSSSINGGKSPWIFNLSIPRERSQKLIVEYFKSKSFKKIALYTPGGDWGEIHAQIVQNAAKEAGVEVVAAERFEYGADPSIFQTLLSRVKAKSPDVLFVTASTSEITNLVKARNQLDIKSPVLSTSDLCDALLSGQINKDSLFEEDRAFGIFAPEDFVKKIRERSPDLPTRYSDLGYDALRLIAKATEATDGSADAIQKYLASGVKTTGLLHDVSFNSDGDVNEGEFQMFQVARECR